MSALLRTRLLCLQAGSARAASAAAAAPRSATSIRHSSSQSSPLVASASRPAHWSLSEYSSASAAVPVAPISPAELAHLCHLSYLAAPSATEAPKLLADLEGVVRWIGTITPIDMSAHEPLYSPLQLKHYYERAETVRKQQKNNAAPTEARAASTDPAVALSESLRDPTSPECVRLRPDAVTDGGIDKAVLANAPYKQRGFFVVPKVVDLEDS